MLTIFWVSQGPLLETYLERGTTVTSATYCDMLQRRLKPAIRSKIKRETVRGRPVVARQSPSPYCGTHVETLGKLKREVIEHPARSPDLATSNFHFFGPLKEALGGSRFRCDVKTTLLTR
jgi:hypothetical protein